MHHCSQQEGRWKHRPLRIDRDTVVMQETEIKPTASRSCAEKEKGESKLEIVPELLQLPPRPLGRTRSPRPASTAVIIQILATCSSTKYSDLLKKVRAVKLIEVIAGIRCSRAITDVIALNFSWQRKCNQAGGYCHTLYINVPEAGRT